MKHLKLKRGLSYMGYGVTATKAKPNVSVADDDLADKLLATGYFEEDKAAKAAEVDPDQLNLSEGEGFTGGSGETEDHDDEEHDDEEHDDESQGKTEQGGAVEAIDTMGVTKLREYAKKHGISGNWPAGTQAEVIREDIRKALAERQ